MLTYISSVLLYIATLPFQSAQTIPDITLTDAVSGNEFSLSSLKDSKAVVVIFTSNYCPYAKLYEKRISSLIDTYRSKNVRFVLINSNDPAQSPGDNPATMSKKVSEMKWNVPFLIDDQQKAASLFGAEKNPEAFVLVSSSQGFQVKYHGSIDDNPQVASDVSHAYLRNAIDAVLKGEPLLVEHTHPTGCMIKK
jgi:glutathione peroxidase-family protein